MIGLGAIDGQSRLDDKGLIDIDKNQIMYFFYNFLRFYSYIKLFLLAFSYI